MLKLLLIIYIIFKSPPVQTYLTTIIASKLSEKLKTTVKVGGVDFSVFKTIVLHRVYIEDRNKDTLLFIKHLYIKLNKFQFNKREINIGELNIYRPVLALKKSNEGILNAQFLFDFFSDTSSTESAPIKFKIKKIRINQGQFLYKDERSYLITDNEINFDNLFLKRININIDSLSVSEDSIAFKILNLSFKEKTGFEIKHLACKGYYINKGIYLNNLVLQTKNSILNTSFFNIKTQQSEDFNYFAEKAQFDVDFNTSKVHSDDLSYFESTIKPLNQYVLINGKVKGPLSSLRLKNFYILFKQKTLLYGNYDIDGLTISDNPYLSLRLKTLKTELQEFDNFVLPGNTEANVLKIPAEIMNLGKILFKGELLGFANDFVLYGKLQTSVGNIRSDITVKYDTLLKTTRINGSLSVNDFSIGKMLKMTPLFNKVTMTSDVNIELWKNKIKGTAKGNIQYIDFNQYTYKNINIDGNFTEKLFDGNLQLNDPNINLEFLGKIDYSGTIPVFNFMADVKNARLNKINLIHPDSNIVLSFLLDSKISGLQLDHMNGNVDLYQVKYKKNQKHFAFPHIHFSANNSNGNKEIIINSNLIDLKVNGHFQFQDIAYNIQSLIQEYLPSLRITDKPKKYTFNTLFNAQLVLTIKEHSDFFKELLPTIYVANNTKITSQLLFPDQIKLSLSSDSFVVQKTTLIGLNTEIRKIATHLETNINVNYLKLSEDLKFNKLNTKIISDNDQNELYIYWQPSDTLVGDGELSSILTYKNNKLNILLNPSRLNINGQNWYINDGNINVSDSIIYIENLMANENEQYFRVNGFLGKKTTDSLIVSIHDFNLSLINPFLKSKSFSIDGILQGNILIRKALDKPIFTTEATVKKFKLNEEDLGDLKILAEWNDEQQILSYQANAFRGNIKTLEAQGTYDNQGMFNANVILDKWRLNSLEPFVSSFAKDVKGIASGKIRLKGTLDNPIVEGKLELTKTAFTIPFLNTRYNFTGEVDIEKNAFIIKEIDLYDEEINKALLSGKISHANYSNFNIDLKLNTKRFLFMNTKHSDTSLYYGSVYASGLVNIQGDLNNINIFANVQTEKGTKFNLNLESREEIVQSDFIKIVNKNITSYKSNIKPSSGLTLTFNIQATPEANVQLIFDSKVGDIIRSQGSGNLRLELKSNGDFLIFGNYIISHGDYLFTLQNIINKKFEVSPGSTVSFNGDPLQATLDIKATYNLRTSLYELMLDSTYKNRVPVECELYLKNKLLSPELNFNIVVPNADSRVEGVINTLSSEEINKQVISLLVLNRFVTPESYKSGIKSVEYSSPNAIGVNSSELLTNQLNHWLSQISKTVNLGVNYRPGSVMTSEELELALNTQILNERVSIHTNFGVSNSIQSESTMLIGDFDIEVKINKSGKLRAKGFNRTNTSILEDTSPYTQGVSIFYREEFDSWQQLFANYWKTIFARKKED